MTFRLDYYNKILTILESLDSDVFEKSSAYFGGGTLIALNFGEYRWSKDVDFICPVPSSGYKHLCSELAMGVAIRTRIVKVGNQGIHIP